RDIGEAREKMQQAIRDGAALKKLAEIIEAQGGDPRVATDTSLLPKAERVVEVPCPADGYVVGVDTEAVGLAAVLLGAGRERVDSKIDPAVGFVLQKRVGDQVRAGEPL